MYTISQLARMFHLSRSTILYYDSIGLLKPDERTNKNYRLYQPRSVKKLEMICELRNTGLSLKSIKQIISNRKAEKDSALQERLHAINQEINTLRKQQQVIVSMLQRKDPARNMRYVSREQWVKFLRTAGLDDKGLYKLHVTFETSSPEGHQDFLESIGLSEKEIKQIRDASKEGLPPEKT